VFEYFANGTKVQGPDNIFVLSVGLLGGKQRGTRNRSLMVVVHGPWSTPHSLNYSSLIIQSKIKDLAKNS
jgi:hypothetical protein